MEVVKSHTMVPAPAVKPMIAAAMIAGRLPWTWVATDWPIGACDLYIAALTAAVPSESTTAAPKPATIAAQMQSAVRSMGTV